MISENKIIVCKCKITNISRAALLLLEINSYPLYQLKVLIEIYQPEVEYSFVTFDTQYSLPLTFERKIHYKNCFCIISGNGDSAIFDLLKNKGFRGISEQAKNFV